VLESLSAQAGATAPLTTVLVAARGRLALVALLFALRDGLAGGLSMGARHGAWCVACCWALMASLFALGVMSVTWMVLVSALVAAEKVLPWLRAVTYATALLLVVLGVMLVAVPEAIPGLTIPGHGSMGGMAP